MKPIEFILVLAMLTILAGGAYGLYWIIRKAVSDSRRSSDRPVTERQLPPTVP